MLEWDIATGDARTAMGHLPAGSVQACVTSPPYWGLRDYGTARFEGGDPGCEHIGQIVRQSYNVQSEKQLSNAGANNVRSGDCACGAVRVDDQIGLEHTPAAYVDAMVGVFREVRRVMRDDGVVWLNIGDSYASGGGHGPSSKTSMIDQESASWKARNFKATRYKSKDLIGIPWMLAFALRDDGWYLRSDTIWAKPNPMPESVTDRPTKSHEYVFLLTKSKRYYYDADAIREKYAESTLKQFDAPYTGAATKDYESAGVQNPSDVKRRITDKQRGHGRRHAGFNDRWELSRDQVRLNKTGGNFSEAYMAQQPGHGAMALDRPLYESANARSVWMIVTEPSDVAHFAVMPKALARKCIMSACPPGGRVLDPFTGAGTTGVVALEEGRAFVGVELNAQYAEIARARCEAVMPLFAQRAAIFRAETGQATS